MLCLCECTLSRRRRRTYLIFRTEQICKKKKRDENGSDTSVHDIVVNFVWNSGWVKFNWIQFSASELRCGAFFKNHNFKITKNRLLFRYDVRYLFEWHTIAFTTNSLHCIFLHNFSFVYSLDVVVSAVVCANIYYVRWMRNKERLIVMCITKNEKEKKKTLWLHKFKVTNGPVAGKTAFCAHFGSHKTIIITDYLLAQQQQLIFPQTLFSLSLFWRANILNAVNLTGESSMDSG